MDTERNEVYERIPWEHLDKQAVDKQWLLVGLAGAVALGALAYSFMKNQPVESIAAAPVAKQTVAQDPPPTVAAGPTTLATLASPVVVSEADLYAVDPQRMAEAVSAHAEWFAVEYFSVDGSVAPSETLRSLLPAGAPLPEAPPGTQVFVDWVGTHQLNQTGDFDYEVDVLVRSLAATSESGFVRQPLRAIRVDVSIAGDGEPRIVSPPMPIAVPAATAGRVELTEVPEDVRAAVAETGIAIGGVPQPDGGWRVLVMATGSDGVTRPLMVDVP